MQISVEIGRAYADMGIESFSQYILAKFIIKLKYNPDHTANNRKTENR